MKKKVFLLFSLLISFGGFAQFDLGIKGGLNFSKISTDAGSFKSNVTESLETKTGFVLGAYARVGKKFFLQPEAVFASKKGSINFISLAQSQKVELKTQNLDVPVLVGYKVLGKIRVYAGPVFSFKLNEDEKFLEELKKVGNNFDQAFANSTYGYQAGLGVKLLGFEIDLRKDGSLSDISSDKFGGDNFSQRISGWQISIAKNIF
jgi:hypothetical protein